MRYEDIKDFSQRCEEHPDHQSGMITNAMIQMRLMEEIDELRNYIEQTEKQEPVGNSSNCGHAEYKPLCQMCMATKQKPDAWSNDGFLHHESKLKEKNNGNF
jgi:hypothetical protein